MKRLIALLLGVLMGAISSPIAFAMSYEESLEYTPDPERTINIVAFDYDVLTTGTYEEIEATLYPSGLLAQTKYGDFTDFIPYEGITYCDYVSDFLWEYYPTVNNEYTYAEYCAAKRLCWIAKVNAAGKSSIYNTLRRYESLIGLRTDKILSDPYITDVEHFHNAALYMKDFMLYAATTDDTFENHELYPELFKMQEDGFFLSIGFISMYDMTKCSTQFNTATRWGYDACVKAQINYYKFFNIKFFDTAIKTDVDLDRPFDVNLIDKETNDYVHPCTVKVDVRNGTPVFDVNWDCYNAAIASREETAQAGPIEQIPDEQFADEPSQAEFEQYMQESTGTQSSTVTGGKAPSNTKQPVTQSSGNLETGIKQDRELSSANPQHSYNPQDIFTFVAIIFIVGVIIAFWIDNYFRKKNDPSRSWKK